MSDIPKAEPGAQLTDEERAEYQRRYADLGHRVQTGIALLMNHGDTLAEQKHLRVGLDLRAADAGALAGLLISKGVFTEREYNDAMIAGLEKEVYRLTVEIEQRLGRRVTLV